MICLPFIDKFYANQMTGFSAKVQYRKIPSSQKKRNIPYNKEMIYRQ